MAFGVTMTYIALQFWFLIDFWQFNAIISFFLALVSFLTCFFKLPETPRYLFSQHRYAEASVVVEQMYFISHGSRIQIELKQGLEVEPSGTLKDLFKHRMLRNNLILLIVIWSFCTFSFFVVPFYLEAIPSNLYLMSTATGIAEIVASALCLGTSERDSQKMVSVFAAVSCLGTGVIYLFQSAEINQTAQAVAYLVQYTGFVATFNTVYVLVNQLFPTIYLATAYGCVNIVGRAVSVSSPMVARMG